MKKHHILICTLISFIILPFGSCKKDFTEINTDPTSSSSQNLDPNYLLTTVQLKYTGSSDGSYETNRVMLNGIAAFIQHLASVGGTYYGDKYQPSPSSTGAYFERAYEEQVKVVVDLYQLTKDKPQYKNLHQIARLMKAMVFERITDLYGDVPYSEAGLGYYNQIYYPKYDKQQDIYADLLKEIEEATAALDNSADKPSGDMYYSKSDQQIDKWKRFGNTLLLRVAMRLTKADPNKAKTYVQKVQGKTFTGNDDNAIVYHDVSGDKLTKNRVSMVFELENEKTYTKLSKRYIDFFKATQDPRLNMVAELENGDRDPAHQVGLPNGKDQSPGPTGIINDPNYPGALNKYSQPSALILQLNAPTFILTYAESELLLADAAQRWGLAGAATHYHDGTVGAITSLGQYGNSTVISVADAEACYAKNPYNPANGLEMINTQFWASTLFNDYESWSNWRRTGYPVLVPVNYKGNATNGTIPRRLPYPLTEAGNNPTNYNAASTSVAGGDNLTSRVWWDK